jgi:hypothetical protein
VKSASARAPIRMAAPVRSAKFYVTRHEVAWKCVRITVPMVKPVRASSTYSSTSAGDRRQQRYRSPHPRRDRTQARQPR